MGADPIAMCGNCREVTAYFNLTKCVGCINERFDTDINKVGGRVVTQEHELRGRDLYTEPPCHQEEVCASLQKVIEHTQNGHRVLIDPCW